MSLDKYLVNLEHELFQIIGFMLMVLIIWVSFLYSTIISNEINDLEVQMISVQERRQTLKKLEQDELREQSVYVSHN